MSTIKFQLGNKMSVPIHCSVFSGLCGFLFNKRVTVLEEEA